MTRNPRPDLLPLVVFQDELAGASDADVAKAAGCHEVIRFSAAYGNDWRTLLHQLDRSLRPGRPVIVFASISVADFIRHHCPALRRGLAYRPDRLCHHVWSAMVPIGMQLNRSFVLIPFGRLADSAGRLAKLYGEKIFLRPDSARKVFPGLRCTTADLAETVRMLDQVHAVDDDCLVLVDQAQQIARHEYRVWMANGTPVSHAAYTFGVNGVDPDHPAPPCPAEILDLAGSLLRRAMLIETIDDLLVADFVLDASGAARLVEFNAWSTSGFYPGADIAAIAKAGLGVLSGA